MHIHRRTSLITSQKLSSSPIVMAYTSSSHMTMKTTYNLPFSFFSPYQYDLQKVRNQRFTKRQSSTIF